MSIFYMQIMVIRSARLFQKLVQKTPRDIQINRRYIKYGAAILAGCATYATIPKEKRTNISCNLKAAYRFLRSLKIGMTISFDYSFSMLGLTESHPNYEVGMSRIHQRAADRILQGCLENGGLYIKLGQGLVAMNHILPAEYLRTLEVLHDKCLTRDCKKIVQLFLEDFGKKPCDMFKEFEDVPIAAASLAQVYKAKTYNNEEVAVKVQYNDLQTRFISDIATINVLLKIIAFMHPSFNFSWVLDDLKDTLKQELDFINEGKNGERCARDLAHLKYVYVPKVYWDMCSTRVLTTEFIHGIKVDDIQSLKKQKYPLKDINQKLFQAFGEQIFYTGFIHADPHPGNVLIRRDENKQVQIVLLDHGLYEKLDPGDRKNLCNFWNSIVLGNREKLQQYSRNLGVEDYEIFAEILTQRPLKLDITFKRRATDKDINYMTQMAKERFDKIMKILRAMPRPMLLVIRNLNTVRSISRNHGDPVNRYTSFARIACQCADSHSTVMRTFTRTKDRLYFEIKLWYSNIRIMLFKIILGLLHYFGHSPDFAKQIA